MGYAKINRNIIDTDIFYDDRLLSFYVRLIMLSRIKPCYDHDILVGKGQLFTSIRKLGSVFNYPASNTYKLLKALKEKHLISIDNYSSGSLITILNYDCDKAPNKNSEQQDKCSAEHFGNTLETPTLLYNKQEKQVKQGVPCARVQNANFENPADDGSVNSDNLINEIYPDCENSKENCKPHGEKLPFPSRGSLVEKYGEENVLDYERRFERWKQRQKKPVLITCYEAIERWMRDDSVKKPCSEANFNTDDIMQRIINSYNS